MLSQTAEYALRAASALAEQPGQLIPSHRLAAQTAVPPDYLAKILGLLVRAGLVRATRGRNGGVMLIRPPSAITLLEVVNAVDPIQRLSGCPLGKVEHAEQLCPLHQQIDDAVALFESALAGRSLGDMAPRPAPAAMPTACAFPRQDPLGPLPQRP